MRRFALSLVAVASLVGVACVAEPAQAEPQPASRPAASQPTSQPAASQPAATTGEIAVFGGGCFWCLETAYEGQPGVLAAISGYAGGKSENPSYKEVSAGGSGHVEVVQVIFDPKRTSYEKLLEHFWRNIDPTQGDGQFCDRGSQYAPAIFPQNDAQRVAAEKSKAALEKSGVLKAPVVATIRPVARFWRAEEYHQDYYRKEPKAYQSYRTGCGRDRRLIELWGKPGAHP
jgi:peptide-methionine (S)-S-oxide reductase